MKTKLKEKKHSQRRIHCKKKQCRFEKEPNRMCGNKNNINPPPEIKN